MGLLNKIFKGRKEAKTGPPEKIEIKIKDLVQWLKDSNSEKISSINSSLSEIWRELIKTSSELKSSMESLGRLKFEPKDKAYAAVNMSKDAFARKSMLLNKIPNSIGEGFSSMQSSYEKAKAIISEIKEANFKQAYSISTYFKNEADGMVKNLKKFEDILKAFYEKLNSDGEILKIIEDISNKAEIYKELESRTKGLEDNKKSLLNKLEKVGLEVEEGKKALEKINSDKRWEQIKAIKGGLEEADSDLDKIKNSLRSEISLISKPIKKISYEIKDDLNKEQKKLLSSLSTEDVEKMLSIISLAEAIISRKNFNGKGFEKAKDITEKIKSGYFEELKSKYYNILNTINSLQSDYSKLSEIEKIKEDKENKIKTAESALAKAGQELEEIDLDIKKAKEAIGNEIDRISKLLLDKLNKNVTIPS